jgi:hypothetical protein
MNFLFSHCDAFHGGDLYNTAEKVKRKSHRRRISAPLTLSLSEEDEFVLPDTPTTSKRNRKYDDDYDNSPKTPITPLSRFSFD